MQDVKTLLHETKERKMPDRRPSVKMRRFHSQTPPARLSNSAADTCTHVHVSIRLSIRLSECSFSKKRQMTERCNIDTTQTIF